MSHLLTKAKTKLSSMKTKIGTISAASIATLPVAMMSQSVFAAGDPTALMSWAVKGVGTLVLVPAVMNLIKGVTSWAEAHADGNGPEAKKATNQISAGVMLAIVSVVLIASSGTLAGFISGSW